MAELVDLALDYLRRLVGKLDDVRGDLDEARAALRGLAERQLKGVRSIGLMREDMARRDRRSDALGRRVRRIERQLELSEQPSR